MRALPERDQSHTNDRDDAAWLYQRAWRINRYVFFALRRDALARAAMLSELRTAYFSRWRAVLLRKRSIKTLADRAERQANDHLTQARHIATFGKASRSRPWTSA
jgi:hypothetical protein